MPAFTGTTRRWSINISIRRKPIVPSEKPEC
jgi:hypothetical protein